MEKATINTPISNTQTDGHGPTAGAQNENTIIPSSNTKPDGPGLPAGAQNGNNIPSNGGSSSNYLTKIMNFLPPQISNYFNEASAAPKDNVDSEKTTIFVKNEDLTKAEDVIAHSRGINAADSVQNTITAYSSFQYLTNKFGNFQLPNVPDSWMISMHLIAAAQKVTYACAAYTAHKNDHNYNMLFIKTLPTILYLTKFGMSEIIIKPMFDTSSTPKYEGYEGKFCAAHASTQFIVDNMGEAAHHFVTGQYSPASALYGTTYTAINCIGNNVELHGYSDYISSAAAFLTGGAVFFYSHQYLPSHYGSFTTYNNILKAAVSTATAKKFFDILFTASTMPGGYFESDSPVCITGETANCIAGNHTAIEIAGNHTAIEAV